MKVIKIPFSKKGTGEELAPDKVLEKTKEFFMSEEGILPNLDVEEADIPDENIYPSALKALKENARPVFLGGDHSVTLPIAKAFAEAYPGNPGIVIFDAHPDARNDLGYEDLLCGLINQNLIKKENIILVGTRNWNNSEIDFIRKNKIKYFPMKEIIAEGVNEVSESWMSVAKNFKDLYVSIDIDVLDPAFAPGTGCTEPGGLSTRELLFFLHRLKKLHNLRAFDLVEVNPKKDVNDMTSKAGAKILVELC